MTCARYIFGPALYQRPFEGAKFTVRIANDLRKATVFLGEEVADDKGQSAIDPRATGFFVTWQSDSTIPINEIEPECSGYYLVTARHVAEPLGASFAIRFNKKGGGSDIEKITGARWTVHPDETVDVAVLHCGFPDWADCIPLPGRLLAKPTVDDTLVSTIGGGDLVFNDPNLGVGDITYVVGLFHLLRGKNVNLPVVHTGHIALLPEDEKIPVRNRLTGKRDEVEGYLVEAHGLEGLSGAPVFARTSSPVTAAYRYEGPPLLGNVKPPQNPIPGRLHSIIVLLGLWSSSWDGGADQALAKAKNLDSKTRVPLGMGVVVPSIKIAETLNQPELIAVRQNEYRRRFDDGAATTDVLPAHGESPRHREDFTSLLNAAARRRTQDDQTSPDEKGGNSGDK